MKEVSFERCLPEEYVKPLAGMLNRFSESALGPGSVASPAAVAVAVAIVIVLWDRRLDELIVNPEDKAALKFAVEQIRAKPEVVRQVTGIELTRAHLKLMEVLSQ